jgi:hypothetical protein
MKTTSTQRTIEAIAGDLVLVRHCTRWLDELYDTLWQANEEWEERGILDEPHPVTQLIDAVYQDLLAAGYWTALKSRDTWKDRARALGFKTDVEKQIEERKKRAAEERASASEGGDAK